MDATKKSALSFLSEKKYRRTMIIIIVVIALVVAAWFGYQQYKKRMVLSPEEQRQQVINNVIQNSPGLPPEVTKPIVDRVTQSSGSSKKEKPMTEAERDAVLKRVMNGQ